MKRVLLDTNVYGLLMFDKLFFDKLRALVPNVFVVYSTSLIRKELRDVSKKSKVEGKSKRNLVLSVHDSFIRKPNHTLEVNEFIVLLANTKINFKIPTFYTYNSFKEYVRRF